MKTSFSTVFFIIFFHLSLSWGQVAPSGVSAKRAPQVDLQQMVRRFHLYSGGTSASSVYAERTSVSKMRWTKVPEVSASELQDIFEKIRDHKPLFDQGGRARRLTWLYPDDGCYARAEMMAGEMSRSGHHQPMKIFVFGNLAVDSPFALGGRVYWWYHVAPVLRVGHKVYVLDPAIDSSGPLLVDNWLGRMNSRVEVSVCSVQSYDPESPCFGGGPGQLNRAQRDEEFFLGAEWQRVLDLGRSPEDDLGGRPPWHDVIF